MAEGPAAKRIRPSEPERQFERTELAAFTTTSRRGYFGESSADTLSNATGEPRIVLGERFGQQRGGSLELPDHAVAEQLDGCQGRFVGRVVVVTGAARGIGEGCARVFHEAGAKVVLADRDEEAARAVASELGDRAVARRDGCAETLVVRTDVSVTSDLQSLVDKTIERFGRIDCVINNAGWHPPHKPIDDFSIDNMQDLMQLNFMSVFALSKFALPHLRKVKGNIINISSLVGHFGQSNATTYAATKGATSSFTKALAIDEAKHGVRVNAVLPGNIWTPLWKAAADAEPDPAAAREAGDRVQVLGRKGTILETGRLCLCIAADLTFTTGVDHIQSGGAELGYGVK